MHRAPQELRTFFVTTVTAQRRELFRAERTARLFLDVLQHYRTQGRYQLHAFVVMPDHAHLILTPAPEVSLEKAVQFIKGGFSFRYKGPFGVWERSYDNRRITDTTAYDNFLAYLHQNPVKARLALNPEDYPYSSASASQAVDPRPAWF